MNRFQKTENCQDIEEKKGKFQHYLMIINIFNQKIKSLYDS